MWKYCSNPYYFKKNYKIKFSTNSMKKKIDRQFWEKNKIKSLKNKKKTMWGNTVAIYNVLKKKTTSLNSQSALY
jgi:predicted nuclease of restriction endonuclease-like (RecB) superfamily